MCAGSHESSVASGEMSSPAGSGRPLDEVLTRRVVIECVRPVVNGGRFPIKRTVGQRVVVFADLLADGHDVVSAVLRDRPVPRSLSRNRSHENAWRECRMSLASPGSDEWTAAFDVVSVGWHEYSVVAWVDRFRTWRRNVEAKAGAGQDVSTELVQGAMLVREASAAAPDADAEW